VCLGDLAHGAEAGELEQEMQASGIHSPIVRDIRTVCP
jgi:hypothetical protein